MKGTRQTLPFVFECAAHFTRERLRMLICILVELMSQTQSQGSMKGMVVA